MVPRSFLALLPEDCLSPAEQSVSEIQFAASCAPDQSLHVGLGCFADLTFREMISGDEGTQESNLGTHLAACSRRRWLRDLANSRDRVERVYAR